MAVSADEDSTMSAPHLRASWAAVVSFDTAGGPGPSALRIATKRCARSVALATPSGHGKVARGVDGNDQRAVGAAGTAKVSFGTFAEPARGVNRSVELCLGHATTRPLRYWPG